MAFDGTEGGQIPLNDASLMTSNYRHNNPTSIKGRFFGKDILNRILEQEGCVGIRVYFGQDEDGNNQLVLVGADSDENDMLDLVADMSFPCPNACSTPNPLNS